MRMKCYCFLLPIFLLSIITPSKAQETEPVLVQQVFWGGRLVDQQTAVQTGHRRFRFEILHRFGIVEEGFGNLAGIYGSSNISMGLAYGVTDRFDVEFQTEKNNKIQEFGAKYILLRQAINKGSLISLAYYANLGLDMRAEERFGISYNFTDRLHYMHQLIASRQINYTFNLLSALSYTHANSATSQVQHDKLELTVAGGYKLNAKHSLFATVQLPFDFMLVHENSHASLKPKPAVAAGYESATYSHNFQFFLTTRDNIIVAKDQINNQNRIGFKYLRVGFNIRVKFGGKHKKGEGTEHY